MRWLATAAFAAAVGLALAGGGGSHARYLTVQLRAQQTDIVGAYDILHRLGLRVEVTQLTPITSLVVPVVKLSPQAAPAPGRRLSPPRRVSRPETVTGHSSGITAVARVIAQLL
jgi:hypothetical protein